jgi:predicted ATPase
MFMRTPAEELTNSIFIIVGNMNQGIRLIKTRAQTHEVARLNLKAGKKAIASSAAKYLLVGISLLNDDSWNSEYDLSLGLYDAGECIRRSACPFHCFIVPLTTSVIS